MEWLNRNPVRSPPGRCLGCGCGDQAHDPVLPHGVSPKATLAGIVPGFNYFAVWYVLALAAYLMIGIETGGRTIEELDAALGRPKPIAARPG